MGAVKNLGATQKFMKYVTSATRNGGKARSAPASGPGVPTGAKLATNEITPCTRVMNGISRMPYVVAMRTLQGSSDFKNWPTAGTRSMAILSSEGEWQS